MYMYYIILNTYILVKIHEYITWIGHDFHIITNQHQKYDWHQYSLLIKSKNDFKLYKLETNIVMKK